MGTTSNDPVTGKPIINSTPQTQSDLQAVADYAATQGPIAVDAFANLDGIPFKRPGMLALVRNEGTDGRVYRLGTSGWKSVDGTVVVNQSGVIAGSAYNGVAPVIIKAFTFTGSPDGTGFLAVAWPGGAFPNGISTVNLTPGDTASGLRYLVMRPNTGLTALGVYAYQSTGAPVTGTCRINVLAAGW